MFEHRHSIDVQDDKTRPNFNTPSELDIGKRIDQSYVSNLNRLPTLSEVLTRKTAQPVDLWSFYIFMRDKQHAIDYLDFWLDAIHHLSLCKHYVKGLRESILIRNSSQFNLLQEHSHVHQLIMSNNPNQQQEEDQEQPIETYRDSTNSDFIDYNSGSNRDSKQSQQRQKSISSSLLLDMIVNENMLEGSDAKRLSLFLRGDMNLDSSDPRIKSLLEEYNRKDYYDEKYEQYQDDEDNDDEDDIASLTQPSPIQHARRVSSHDQLLTPKQEESTFPSNNQGTNFPIDNSSNTNFVKVTPKNRLSSINPALLERIIKDPELHNGIKIKNNFITRATLKDSSRNLLLKYFVEDAEKKLYLPDSIVNNVIQSVDIEGRDDPDVFQPARDYVFKVMENEAFPNFLQSVAISNITDFSFSIRLIAGLFFLFIAFWVAYILLFLDYPKHERAVIVVPFLFGAYLIISAIYYIDPLLCFIGFSESNASQNGLIRLKESFVKKLLIKRSLWVLFLILFATVALTLIFSLVPGHRL